MNIRQALSSTIARFKTLSVNHPLGMKWDRNGVMTVYQLGTKFNISNLFDYCYMPKKSTIAVVFPDELQRMLEVQHYLENEGDDIIVAPTEWGFDVLKPNRGGDPLLVHEVRFYSVKNKFVMWYMTFIPTYRKVIKNLK